jgi:phosphate uptake regulator
VPKISQQRKLIKWGSSETLILSLPRKWVIQNNLTADQVVNLQVNQDGTLTIIPLDLRPDVDELQTEIKIKDIDDMENIRLRLLTKFLDGWDIIRIKSVEEFHPDIRRKLEHILEPMMGLEIMGINPKEILIKNVMSVESSNVYNLVKMISDLVIELNGILLNRLNNKDADKKNDGDIEWENIKKYHYRVIREHRKTLLHPIALIKMNLTLQDIVDFFSYISSIHKIGESTRYIITTINKHGLPPDSFEITPFTKKVLDEHVRNSIDAFLFKDTKKAIKTIKAIKELKPKKRNIENKVDATESDSHPKLLTFQILLDVCSKILDSCEEICLAALRRAI